MPNFKLKTLIPGTRSKHSQQPRALPAPPAQTRTIAETQSKPETREDKNAEEDDKINTEQGGSTEDTADKGKKSTPNPNVVKDNRIVNKEVISDPKTAVAQKAYSTLWSLVTDHSMTQLKSTEYSEFVPSVIPLTELLLQAIPIISRSKWVMQHKRDFNPYAAAIGAYYVYYICILRAKNAAGHIDGYERAAFVDLDKAIPLEKIDIPEFLIPYYESIVATQLEDSKYGWIVPSYGSLEHMTTFANYTQAGALNHARPNIPLMLANLSSFGASSARELRTRLDESLTYRPYSFTDNAGARITTRVFGEDVDFSTATALSENSRAHLLNYQGMNFPFQFWNQNYTTAQDALKNSNFYGRRGVNFTLIRNQHMPNTSTAMEEDYTFNNAEGTRIDRFLMLDKARTKHFLDIVFENFNVLSKFFKNNTNADKLPTTGGLEACVIAALKTGSLSGRTAGAAANDIYKYTDARVGQTDARNFRMYFNPFTDLTASFRCPRADLMHNEELQALTFGITSPPPIQMNTATRKLFLSGRFYDHALITGEGANAVDVFRYGLLADDEEGEKDMYQGWRTNYIQPLMLEKPTD